MGKEAHVAIEAFLATMTASLQTKDHLRTGTEKVNIATKIRERRQLIVIWDSSSALESWTLIGKLAICASS